jgi:hypothetical protein
VNKKEFFALVLVACFFSVLINIALVIHFSDSIAKVLGYLVTLVVLPFIVALVPSCVILLAATKEFSRKQQICLFAYPMLLICFILVYYYWMLTYGGPL